MNDSTSKLEELLIKHGLLKPEQLEYAVQRARSQSVSLEEVIKSEQMVYPEPLAQLKAEAASVPYINLQSAQVDPETMKGISPKAAATYQFIAFRQTGTTLGFAVADPDNIQTQEAIRFIAKKRGLTPEIFCASPEAINQQLGAGKSTSRKEVINFDQDLDRSGPISKDQQRLQRMLEEAPVNKAFAVIMKHAIDGSASDIHIEPMSTQLRIRYRINRQLHISLLLPAKVHAPLVSRLKILANLQVTQSLAPRTGRFTYRNNNYIYSIKVSTLPTIYGEKITLHLINTSKVSPSYKELGLIGQPHKDVVQLLRDPQGLVIVTGPDGSGRSTTINTILSQLNSPAVSICTIEETVEYEIPGITQTQISPEQNFTFATAIHYVLQSDPDIVMVEEIRDSDTAHLLTKGALGGRLMISSLSTKGALGSIPQLIDLGVTPYVLSSSLKILIAQRLVPKLCQSCRREKAVPKGLQSEIKEQLNAIPASVKADYKLTDKPALYDSPGCPKCNERGTRGQIAIFEVIPITNDLAQLISAGESGKIRSLVKQKKYLTLKQDGLLKALLGLVRYKDVVRVVS